jgi:diguanylate cyclase (GGDEF)-like protein
VLLDLGLPDAQELDALTALVEVVPDLPIIILSGAENEVLALEAVKAGAQDYLIKGQATIDLLARAIRYAIERKQSELCIKDLAYRDSLTHLPNRRLLLEHLNAVLRRAHRERYMVGVLFLDIDQFKHVNDTLGHEVGDSLLQQLARRLTASLRDSDSLARLSGDEFVAVVEVKRHAELGLVADHLLHHLRLPFKTPAGDLFITASIGVSSSPTDGVDARELLRNADRAMYRAKAEGRDTYRSYS